MPKYFKGACLLVLLTHVVGCGTSKVTENPDSPSPTVQNPQSQDDAPSESAVLKQEMLDVMVEVMTAQEDHADRDALRGQIEAAIVEMRKHYPEFLIVSAETEGKLQDGTPIEDSAKRIAEAEGLLKTFEIKLSGLAQTLLSQQKAGKLSPVRTELLAQMLVADMKKAEYALTN